MTAIPIEDLLPHRGPMLLIDRVLFDDGETTRVEATIRGDGPFVRDEVMPSWVGIELMAQTVATWAGLRRRAAGDRVKLGFLLGTRKFDADPAGLKVGTRVEIEAKQEIVSAQGLAVFACTITEQTSAGARVVAQANVNVFQPDDVDGYLKELMRG